MKLEEILNLARQSTHGRSGKEMNTIFQPEDFQSGNNNITLIMIENSATIDQWIIYLNFILVNLAIVLPPYLHISGPLKLQKTVKCSKFIMATVTGCLVSAIFGVHSMVSAFLSETRDVKDKVCETFVNVDGCIFLILIVCALVNHAKRKSGLMRNISSMAIGFCTTLAVATQIATFADTGSVHCISKTVVIRDVVFFQLPLIEITGANSIYTVLIRILMYSPMAIIFVTSQSRQEQEKKSTLLDLRANVPRSCCVCTKTLNIFNVWWYKDLLFVGLGVLRPLCIFWNWHHHSQLTDFPPNLLTVLIFYPFCLATTVNCVRRLLTELHQSPIFHL